MRLLAAHARRSSVPAASVWARFRAGAISGVAAAGLAVAAFSVWDGRGLTTAASPSADPASAMVDRFSAPGTFARVRVVDDARPGAAAIDPVSAATNVLDGP